MEAAVWRPARSNQGGSVHAGLGRACLVVFTVTAPNLLRREGRPVSLFVKTTLATVSRKGLQPSVLLEPACKVVTGQSRR